MYKQWFVRMMNAVMVLLAVTAAQPGFAGSIPKNLEHAVTSGAQIFSNDSFGSHLRPVLDASVLFQDAHVGGGHTRPAHRFVTCATCHINGGKTRGLLADGKRIASLRNAAAVFPRYSKATHHVVTLELQIQRCVTTGVLGHAPAAQSQTMVDLVSYLTSIARGQPVRIGGPFH